MQVFNASGSTTNGIPYVQYNFPLASAATVDFAIEYYSTNGQTFSTPTYVPQVTTAVTLTITNGVGIAVSQIHPLAGVLVGFWHRCGSQQRDAV